MNRLTILSCIFVGGAFAVSSAAQEGKLEDFPPPKAPFVAPMPQFATWKLTFLRSKSRSNEPDKKDKGKSENGRFDALVDPKDSPAELELKSITSIKTGDVKNEIFQWFGGKSTEAWTIGGLQAMEDPQSENIILNSEAFGSAATSLKSDFPLLGWLDLASYLGIQSVKGEPCYAYECKRALFLTFGHLALDPWGGKTPTLRAFISAKTGVPVAMQTGDQGVDFAVLEPPTEMLVAPHKFAAAILDCRQKINAALRVPKVP